MLENVVTEATTQKGLSLKLRIVYHRMKAQGENMQDWADAGKTALNYPYVLELLTMNNFKILGILEILNILLSLQGLRTWPTLSFGS